MVKRKAQFLSELEVELAHGSDRIWRLKSKLGYYSALLKREIWMPEGFHTDFASVPRVPIIWLFWGGRVHREPVLHDFVFCYDSDPVVSYSVANALFLEAMTARNKALGVRYPMYWGVAVGSWPYFHKRSFKDTLMDDRKKMTLLKRGTESNNGR